MDSNKIRLYQVEEQETVFKSYRFYLSTDEYFLFDSARLALKNHGSIDTVINGTVTFYQYHRDQGYRSYMVWGQLPITADTTRFLHELLNRQNETLIDSQGRIVGIVAKDI